MKTKNKELKEKVLANWPFTLTGLQWIGFLTYIGSDHWYTLGRGVGRAVAGKTEIRLKVHMQTVPGPQTIFSTPHSQMTTPNTCLFPAQKTVGETGRRGGRGGELENLYTSGP